MKAAYEAGKTGAKVYRLKRVRCALQPHHPNLDLRGLAPEVLFKNMSPADIDALDEATFQATIDEWKRANGIGVVSNAGHIARTPTHLTLHSGAVARDRETGKTCRVVARVWGGGAWTVWVPGVDKLVERPADKLEAIEDPARPMPRPAAPRTAAREDSDTEGEEDSDTEGEAAPQQVAPRRPVRAAAAKAARKLEEQAGQVVQEGAETPDVFPPPSPASDDAEAPAAPTPDGPTHRARLLAAQGPAVFDPFTETALGVHVGTSQAFEEAVAARSEKIRSLKSSQLVQHNFSEPEVRFVTGAWAPNIRNLAVAEILGDAAPSASSPRDPSPDELAAMLKRFVLNGGNVNALLAGANVAPMET